MSSLHHTDLRFHHEDGSHRWGGGPADRRGQEVYQAELRAHMDAHRAEFRGGSVPRQRTATCDQPRRTEHAA